MKKKIALFAGLSLGLAFAYTKLKQNKKQSDNPSDILFEELENSINNEWKHDFIEVNQVKLHYVTQGEGSLLILLHGFPESWFSWRQQISYFADKFKVVAPDMRGYNLSDKPSHIKDYRISVLISDIKELIKSLGYEKAVVVGHDWGGVVAWSFAMTYPDNLEKLIILNSPHPFGYKKSLLKTTQLLHSWYILFFQLPFIPEAIMSVNDYKESAKSLSKTSSFPEKAFSENDMLYYRKSISQPKANTSMINYYRALSRFGFDTKLKAIEKPVLIIWGEKDKFLLKDVNNGIERYVPQLTIKYIPEASHWVHRDMPDEVNKTMKDFLNPSEI